MKVGDVVGAVCWAGNKRAAIVLAVRREPNGDELLKLVTMNPHEVDWGPGGRPVVILDNVPRTDQAADRMGWTWDISPTGPVQARPLP